MTLSSSDSDGDILFVDLRNVCVSLLYVLRYTLQFTRCALHVTRYALHVIRFTLGDAQDMEHLDASNVDGVGEGRCVCVYIYSVVHDISVNYFREIWHEIAGILTKT